MITKRPSFLNTLPVIKECRYLTINCAPFTYSIPEVLHAPKHSNANTTYDFDITKRIRYMKF